LPLRGFGFADGCPANPVAGFSKAAADVSPSPWGEGRDEGVVKSNRGGLAAPELDEGGEHAKSFLGIRSCISRGSRSNCLGAQGKCAKVLENENQILMGFLAGRNWLCDLVFFT
jgi:hypothetical protein